MLRLLLVLLHTALGIAAIGAGQALVRDPSGAPLSFELAWLEDSPFEDYRIPGFFLAVVIAGANLASALALVRSRLLGPFVSLATGFLLLLWIGIQTWAIGFQHWSQAAWIGLFLLVTALALREVRRLIVGFLLRIWGAIRTRAAGLGALLYRLWLRLLPLLTRLTLAVWRRLASLVRAVVGVPLRLLPGRG